MSELVSPETPTEAPPEPERVRRIREYVARWQPTAARPTRVRAPIAAPPRPGRWMQSRSATGSLLRVALGGLSLLTGMVPFGVLYLVDTLKDAPGAPHFMTTLGNAWVGLIGLLLVAALFFGVLAYGGPNWRKWVQFDRIDETIEGKPHVAEFTTAYRLRQVVYYLLGGLFFAGFAAWLFAPLVVELGAVPTVALVLAISALYLGFVALGIAGIAYVMNGSVLPALARAGFGAAAAVAGFVLGWAALAGRLEGVVIP